jgi:hypothetical protein
MCGGTSDWEEVVAIHFAGSFGRIFGGGKRKNHKGRNRGEALRKAVAEALEKRQLLTVTGASVTPLSAAVEGASVSVGLSASSDDSSINSFVVSWGDGSSDTLGGDATAASHTYTNFGNYSVAAAASDDDPSSLTSDPVSINVADASISAVGDSSLSTTVGANWSGTLATIADANPNETGGNLSATIAWSDGLTDTGAISADGTGGFKVTDSRTFNSPGGVSASVTINDAGGSPTSASSYVSVYGLSSFSLDDSVAVAVGQTQYVNVNVSGNFAGEDDVFLTAPTGNATIGTPNVSWNNNGGGTFSFPVTGASTGALTFDATESAFNGAASTSDNAVIGLTNFTVDNNVSLGMNQSGTVNVNVSGTFAQEDSGKSKGVGSKYHSANHKSAPPRAL